MYFLNLVLESREIHTKYHLLKIKFLTKMKQKLPKKMMI